MIPKRQNSEKNLIILRKRLEKLENEKKENFDFFSKEIENLQERIKKDKLVAQQEYRALQDFVRLLTNFASHDIKNIVHNLDGLVVNLKNNYISDEDIISAKLCVTGIRAALEEFKVLSSDREKKSFTIQELTTALESLHRALLKKNKIYFSFEYIEITKDQIINQVFHQILQLLNNLVINSYEFLDPEIRAPEIKIKIILKDNIVNFYVCDTGIGVEEGLEDDMFLPYKTTKENGSGVGLSHVRYVSESLGGQIQYLGKDDKYNTIFCLSLPI
ncbi:sensor histidine kinase [Myroides fluvii]|uniref:sensor histidine kinase n=1 Tax=Myroides fluvii TaxID=2572594 RepID=UPI00131B8106|nr:sensor histidine kinase [Myroides fluvii]